MDGCLYAVKCTRRRFRGEADRQNMLREVYALAAVCDAQDTTNIVRYHQVIEEREDLPHLIACVMFFFSRGGGWEARKRKLAFMHGCSDCVYFRFSACRSVKALRIRIVQRF